MEVKPVFSNAVTVCDCKTRPDRVQLRPFLADYIVYLFITQQFLLYPTPILIGSATEQLLQT